MSGGAWEYMMSVLVDQNGTPMSGSNSINNSGFNGPFGCPTCDHDNSGLTELTTGKDLPTNTKYYDTYAYAENDKSYQNRILGDATGETGPFSLATNDTQTRQIGSWYQDEAWFVYNVGPWLMRSATHSYGMNSGIFSYRRDFGRAGAGSFRVVLSF